MIYVHSLAGFRERKVSFLMNPILNWCVKTSILLHLLCVDSLSTEKVVDVRKVCVKSWVKFIYALEANVVDVRFSKRLSVHVTSCFSSLHL